MPEMLWYYVREGKQAGPVSFELLQVLAKQGQIQPSTLVWCEAMSNWQAAQSVAGLFSAPNQQVPPPMMGQQSTPPFAATYHTLDYQPYSLAESHLGLAVAGFVLAFVFAPVGTALCIIALHKMNSSPNKEGQGLALAGLIISIVFCCIGFCCCGGGWLPAFHRWSLMGP